MRWRFCQRIEHTSRVGEALLSKRNASYHCCPYSNPGGRTQIKEAGTDVPHRTRAALSQVLLSISSATTNAYRGPRQSPVSHCVEAQPLLARGLLTCASVCSVARP